MGWPGRIVLAGALWAGILSPLPLGAADVFTVSGLAIDATASTAALARDRALADGQARAFEVVFRRLVPRESWPRRGEIGTPELARMIRDFSVDHERTSPVRYLAELTVRFEPDQLRQAFRAAGIPFAETRSRPVLLLPILDSAGVYALWDDPNPWRKAWDPALSGQGLVPLRLPAGDLRDMALIGAEQAVRGISERLAAMARRHQSGTVIVAVATRSPLGDRYQVELRRHAFEPGETGPEVIRFQPFAREPGESEAEALTSIALGIAGWLEEDWKTRNLLRSGDVGELMAEVPLQGLDEWIGILRRLDAVAVVDSHHPVFLSRSLARIRIVHYGDLDQLVVALAQNDLRLSRGAVHWQLGTRGGEAPSP